MDTGPIIILANDQKCCYYQSSIQYIARIITTILHHNRHTAECGIDDQSLIAIQLDSQFAFFLFFSYERYKYMKDKPPQLCKHPI
jgi:hypothetical protein